MCWSNRSFLNEAIGSLSRRGFALNIVSGKSYDTQTEEGRSLWAAVRRAMPVVERVEDSGVISTEPIGARFGEACLARSRLGQGAFRVLDTDALSAPLRGDRRKDLACA